MATSIRKLNQTGHQHDQPALETLRDNLPLVITDESEQIVDAFESGLNILSQSPPSIPVDEAAKTFFTAIRRILPLTADTGKQAFLLEKLASVLMRTAQQTPSRHIGQELLLNTVNLIISSPEEAWRSEFLVALGMRMRDGWSGKSSTHFVFIVVSYLANAEFLTGFTMENGEEEDDVQTPDEWLNLNSFNARLFGSGITRWRNFPIWQLREGLEAELGPDPHENDCRIAVACEWIIQAGPKLLRDTLLNDNDLDEAQKRSLRGGELWSGLPGLNTERWDFWRRRLAAVRASVTTQLTLDNLEHAERVMMDVEKSLAALMI